MTILVIGPVSNVLANAIAAAYNFLANNVPALAAILVGGIWQVFVIFGVHWGVTPMCLANFANYGCDSFQAFQTCAVIAQAAACFGVFLKTKKADIKNVSLSAGLTGIFGITEPAIFGVNLRYFKPFIGGLAGGACGALYASIVGLGATGTGVTGIFGILLHLHMPLQYLIMMAISFGVSFAVTWVIWKPEEENA